MVCVSFGKPGFVACLLRQTLDALGKARASEEEIREFCRSNIAHFNIPRYIWFVEEFPVTGKLQKLHMRKIAVEKLRQTG